MLSIPYGMLSREWAGGRELVSVRCVCVRGGHRVPGGSRVRVIRWAIAISHPKLNIRRTGSSVDAQDAGRGVQVMGGRHT